MTSAQEVSITQVRVQVLNEFCTNYANAVKAYNDGRLTDRELDHMKLHYHRKAVQRMVIEGQLDYEPAENMIYDQEQCINPQTGEVIL